MLDQYSVSSFVCDVTRKESKYLVKQAANSIEDCARTIHATLDARRKEKKRKS